MSLMSPNDVKILSIVAPLVTLKSRFPLAFFTKKRILFLFKSDNLISAFVDSSNGFVLI